MAVQNSLAKEKKDKPIEYLCGDETVKLSPSIIREYLVSGSGTVTDQEVTMFLNLCRFQHLNPFLREAYLIKFGNSPASMVTGKEVFTKRARRNTDYKGVEAGVILLADNGDVIERTGTFKLPSDELVGGWAKVYIDGYVKPVEMTVSLEEYIGIKKDGEINSQWSKKPATMIRKVALVQALREAFPEDFQGMYSQEEVSNIAIELDTMPVEIIEQSQIKQEEDTQQTQQALPKNSNPFADETGDNNA